MPILLFSVKITIIIDTNYQIRLGRFQIECLILLIFYEGWQFVAIIIFDALKK